MRLAAAGKLLFAHQRQVGNGNHPRSALPRLRVAEAVAEGVELLDVSQPNARLLPRPTSQAALQGVMLLRPQRTERQRVRRSAAHQGVVGAADRQHARHFVRHGDDDRVQADDHGRRQRGGGSL